MSDSARHCEGQFFEQPPSQPDEFAKAGNFLSEHPEMKNNLKLPPELASLLVPGSLKADENLELRLGRRNGSSSFEMMVTDKKVPYNKGAVRQNMSFDESRDPGNFFAGGERPKTPVLYAQLDLLNDDRRALILSTVDVNRNYQGQGIGAEFQERLEKLARELGFELILAEAVNPGAFKFNVKSGFSKLTDRKILSAMKRQGFKGSEDGYIPVVKRL